MRQLVLKHRKYLKFFLFLIMGIFSCDKIYDSTIPDVYVYFTINLISENSLTVPGNSVYFPGVGYGGVIVTCEQPGAVYYAFDAACTKEAGRNCLVLKDEKPDHCPCLLKNLILTCTCCESQYLTFNGVLTKGPATMSLKQYNVSLLNNSTTLLIYN